MRSPCVCSGMPDAHEVFAASMNEQRYWSVGLVVNDTEIFTLRIDRPRLHFCKPMCCGIAHGILNLRIVPSLDGGIVPPIKAMAYVASIAQPDVLFENGRTRAQNQFDGPFHSVDSVDIPNDDRCTTILAALIGKIHR